MTTAPAQAATITGLVADLKAEGHALVSAMPRSGEHLLLRVRRADGAEVAGQWFVSAARAAHVAAATRRSSREADPDVASAVHLVGAHTVLQPGGADRRLTGLGRLAADPALELVAHRPERRAVVRHRSGASYTKVVRPDRLARVVDPLRHVAATSGPRVAEVLASDPARGTVRLAALPGRPLHDLGDSSGPATLAAVGAAVRRLHRTPVFADADLHGPAAELGTVRRWHDLAASYDVWPLPAADTARLLARAEALLSGVSGPEVLLHRDLHDKQILVDGDSVGLLDLDLAAAGHAALDLANLLVHLELRARQGLLPAGRLGALADALLEGYDADPAVRAGLPAYALATRLRLVGVYAFRPSGAAAATALLMDPLLADLTG